MAFIGPTTCLTHPAVVSCRWARAVGVAKPPLKPLLPCFLATHQKSSWPSLTATRIFAFPFHHLQVELNTIASSFGCLSALTTRLHNYIASRVTVLDGSRLPTNNAIEGIPAGLAAAAKAHGAAGGVVVMVVQPGERNAYDQQWLQLQLWEQHGMRTLRCTLREIADEAQLGEGGAMTIRGHPVSVVYFRAGYTPNDYPSEVEWQAREVIERSNAAKCPTVAYQLAGAKKVQQDLARPGVLERFTDSEQVRNRMIHDTGGHNGQQHRFTPNPYLCRNAPLFTYSQPFLRGTAVRACEPCLQPCLPMVM